MSTVQYLNLFLEPVALAFSPDFATAVVNLRVDEATERHVEALRAKANSGTLTAAEDADYRAFVEAVDVIGVIQSKARRFLAQQHG